MRELYDSRRPLIRLTPSQRVRRSLRLARMSVRRRFAVNAMPPINKVRNLSILVAVDGSVSSNNALRQTIEFAKHANCNVTAVAVVPHFEGELELIGLRNMQEAFKEPGEKVLAQAREIAAELNVNMHTILAEGNAHEAIVDTALDRDCDLIVMGRRGLTRLERAFMGSITQRVIGYSPIDVLVMPYNSELKWDNILLAVDGSACSDVAANSAITLAHAYGSKLSIVSVVDVPPEAYAEAYGAIEKMISRSREVVGAIEVMASAAGVEAETFVREGITHEKIIDLADEQGTDIICIGSHGRTGLKKFLLGSVAERIIGYAKCPVLVVRQH